MKEVLALHPQVSEYAREAISTCRHTNQGICSTRGNRRFEVILYGYALSKYFYRGNGLSRKTRICLRAGYGKKPGDNDSPDQNLGRKILSRLSFLREWTE